MLSLHGSVICCKDWSHWDLLLQKEDQIPERWQGSGKGEPRLRGLPVPLAGPLDFTGRGECVAEKYQLEQ